MIASAEPDEAEVALDVAIPDGQGRLLVLTDGRCLHRDPAGRLVESTVSFAWRGSARIDLVASTGARTPHRWRWRRTQLAADEWASLCRWLLWLERGPREPLAA